MAKDAIDRFSVVHAGLGAAMAAWGFSPQFSIGSHVAFEVLEDKYFKPLVHDYWPQPYPDSIQNHVGDVAFFTAGYFATKKLEQSESGQAAVAAFIGLAAALWIADVMKTPAVERERNEKLLHYLNS